MGARLNCIVSRRPLAAFLLAAVIAWPLIPVAATAARGPEAIADVTAQVIDTVVKVTTKQKVDMSSNAIPQLPPGVPLDKFLQDLLRKHRQSEQGQVPRRVDLLGSGFIIDPSGLVVTNEHVIHGADEVEVVLKDGTHLKADIVGVDKLTDLALLRIHPSKPLKAIKWGDSDKLRLGDWVIAIGTPFGLGDTVTAGIVSARHRDIQSSSYDDYIQTDAPINRGNSGGPLFNLDGEVIGVNTAIISPSGGSIGIGFAIPSDSVLPVIEQLRAHGMVERGWLGVRIQQVTDEIANSFNIKPARGALVGGVIDHGPAQGAIETGDVIVKFDGKDIKDVRQLQRVVASTEIGKTVAVEHKIKDNVKGVLITAVDPDSKAAEKHLMPGMVIAEVQQQPVANAAELKQRLDALKKQGKKTVVLLIDTPDGDSRFVALAMQ
jgi:serine protease Do